MRQARGELKKTVLMLAAGLLASTLVCAQSTGPRDLAELKQETQRRADRSLPPVSGVRPDDVREAMSNLNSLEPDAWAAAFSRIGDRYMDKAKSQQAGAPREAAESYKHAWETYNFARWPVENSAGKKQAYAKALEAFAAYGRLIEPPLEIVRIPFEGKEIVGYLRLPPNVRPAPLLIGISGLDTRKEDVAANSDGLIRRGIAVLALDMPGTGQAPLKVDVGAERMYSRALDYLQTRPEIDAKRIVVRGQSWSGYWAAKLAYTERERLRGAVVHGVGIHGYFQPEFQKKGLTTREYLFDLVSRALRGLRSQDDGRVPRLRSAPVAARRRLSRQAVGAHAPRQRRKGHPAADRGPVFDDEARRPQRCLGQSGRRPYGSVGAVAAAYDPRPSRDAVDRARLERATAKMIFMKQVKQWQLLT
jgi:pimeloyl-ACP methyl ester carboxylesterase